jgi:vacuolar protein sorting-associated protein 35
MATTTATPTVVVEEGKLLSESLSIVKIQVGQMKRHLVSAAYLLGGFSSLAS